jgi:tetratricopeptide (TPR) repeat protein
MSGPSVPWLATLGAAVAGGVGAAVVTVLVTAPSSRAPAVGVEASADLADLRQRVADLHARVVELTSGTAAPGATPARRPVTDDDELARAVDRVLRARGLVAPVDARADRPTLDVDSTVVRLLELGRQPAAAELWERVRATEHVDGVVAAFERRAAEAPRSPDARVDLGLAYVQKLLSMSDGIDKARVGADADRAFTEALELDPNHWEARFRKAEGLSYWPAASGKRAEAIDHFEVLAAQQETGAPRPEQADTYVLLGTLYEQHGQPDKAAAIWSRGAARHPDHAALRERSQRRRQ